jgi:hypothetical protein
MFFKQPPPILTVLLEGREICRVARKDIPAEVRPTVEIHERDAAIIFAEADGREIVHSLGGRTGWFGFSIRIYPNLACQTDCVFGNTKNLSPEQLRTGEISGIRFQPFFIGQGRSNEEGLKGRGLFHRGLHYSGVITPGSVFLSCICDACARSFLLKSFHAGFSNCGYLYSDSGIYTLTIPDHVEGCPPALGEPDTEGLTALESILPKAPDGTSFSYLNPLGCPHCSAPYIDFKKFPQDRKSEYYGNILNGMEALHYVPRDSGSRSKG